ncbi:MAG: 23S rRNA (guanosine(2251)-2'-O)-methyltransferase RlmB [Deltaproteobacteria bacterium]|nr:23S rRNA (guanosine(2251)-2'-O)-methyltransferase RlmB [Deltaproteobacteria bacterium]
MRDDRKRSRSATGHEASELAGSDEERPRSGRLVYGVHPVLSAVRAGQKIRRLYATAQVAQRIRDELGRSVEPIVVDRSALDVWTDRANHQGVVAFTGAFSYLDLPEIEDLVTDRNEAGRPVLLVVLDRIEDPRNLGAILRSAHELGADAVILPQRQAAAVTPAAIKTSAGACEFVPVARVVNLARTLEILSRLGVSAIGAAGEQGQAPEDVDMTGSIALVLGSEGRGIREHLRHRCMAQVAIPMQGNVGSLNVSVAAGILLAEAARQRRAHHFSDPVG